MTQMSCCQIDWIEMWAHWMGKITPILMEREWKKKNILKNGCHPFWFRAAHESSGTHQYSSAAFPTILWTANKTHLAWMWIMRNWKIEPNRSPLMCCSLHLLRLESFLLICNKCKMFTKMKISFACQHKANGRISLTANQYRTVQ